MLRFRHAEAGIDHAKRAEDALLEEGAETPAGDDFDQPPQHIGRDAVIPARARLGDQRQLLSFLHHLLGRLAAIAVDLLLDIGFLDRSVAEEAIGEAGSVAQQILNRDRPGLARSSVFSPAAFVRTVPTCSSASSGI
ncbi:MAG: hypothetical protein WDN69_25765 [Aliidongia sp.]